METIEKGLSNLQNEVIVVKTKLSEPTDDERKHLERENESLYEDLIRLKSHSMKYNLIFEGIPQEIGENTEAVVKKIVKEKLDIKICMI
jgi:hypothetical protein